VIGGNNDRRTGRHGLLTYLLHRVHLDPLLLAGLLTVMAFGSFVLYSAAGNDFDLLLRQGARIGAAMAVMIAVAQINVAWLRRVAPWVYAVGLITLVLVLISGEMGGGAQRWLNIGIRFQPSELMKLAVPAMLAWVLHERPLPPTMGMNLMLAVLIATPVAMIALQPDLGTSIMIALTGITVIFLAGISMAYIVAAVPIGVGAALILWNFYMHDYQKQRVMTLLDPEKDPLGSGYHIIQSKIAIGSGGSFGKGWLNGSQGQLEFLPERTTDFIFAVIGEEFGFIGVTALLLLYMLIVVRGFFISAAAQDTFSRLLAGSISFTFFFYVFVNTAMVTGLLPVVGVPLPLISAGGTSMVTLLAGFGILMSIQTHRKLLPR
jgi:rod shape determining protein RodA